jgi:Flp pilus assembly pilin Flp
MAEYAVVLGMITAGIVLAVATLSGVVQASFERVNDLIEPLL